MILTYKGIKINYNTCGNGSTLVFLHGFLENSEMWNSSVSFFSKYYNCVSIDLLGHGDSENLGYIHTMEDMATMVKAVLDKLQITKATFIGHSMGGYVALATLDLFPEIVSGLVLLNSTSFPDSEERKITRTRAIEIVKKNPNAYTSMAIANLFAPDNRDKFKEEISLIKNQASRTSLQGIISALEGMKIRKDRVDTLTSFTGRKILMVGKLDPVLSYNQSEIEAVRCRIDLVTFSGGHMTHIENEKRFLHELNKFLSYSQN